MFKIFKHFCLFVNISRKVQSCRPYRFVPGSNSFPRSLCAVSVEMIIYAFCDFEFSQSQLINIHEKIGT